MEEFVLEDYKNKNTKVKIFIEYLYEKFGDGTKNFNNTYLKTLTIENLIESLERYVTNSKITSQRTADTYISDISNFFKFLSDEYGIKNNIFNDIQLKNKLHVDSRLVISELKPKIPKGIATDEEYEELLEVINNYLENFNQEEIIKEIDRIFEGMIKDEKKYTSEYYYYVSIIPLKLILKYALKNLTVISIDLKDLDLEKGTININSIKLPLDKELIELLKTYIEIREYILNLYKKKENKLFVKEDGSPFIKSNYAEFFKIMTKTEKKSQAVEKFAKKRALEMFEKNFDMFAYSKLTNSSGDNIIKLLESTLDNTVMNDSIQKFFNENTGVDKKYIINKMENESSSIVCPFCKKKSPAKSDNWVIVQFGNEDNKYITCKTCRGENGKNIL